MSASGMRVLHTVAELQALGHEQKRGAVFTMGALHAGHAELLRRCRELIGPDGILIATVFVNPTQFTDAADLAGYPRTPEVDIQVCEAAGVDVLFLPSVEEMYPQGQQLPQPAVGELGDILEGASRPGHFAAVAKVVHRLISVTEPAVTCFGEKDYQQLVVVRRMVEQSGLPCEVVGVPTVRDGEGLALSSRNSRLSASARALAPQLHAALTAVVEQLAAGVSPDLALAAGRNLLAAKPEFELDYLVITDEQLDTSAMPKTGQPWRGRVLAAAWLDGVRLIDNVPAEVSA